MLEFLFLFAILALAVANLSNLLTTVDLLECPRKWFERNFPRLAKLATCQLCQSFWMSGASSVFLSLWAWEGFSGWVPIWARIPVVWLAIHLAARMIHLVVDGVPIRTPVGLYAMVSIQKDDPPRDAPGSAP
jgi:hypothetical protein